MLGGARVRGSRCSCICVGLRTYGFDMFQRVMKRQENEGGKGGLGRIIINELPGTSGRQQGVVYLTKPTIYQNQKLE